MNIASDREGVRRMSLSRSRPLPSLKCKSPKMTSAGPLKTRCSARANEVHRDIFPGPAPRALNSACTTSHVARTSSTTTKDSEETSTSECDRTLSCTFQRISSDGGDAPSAPSFDVSRRSTAEAATGKVEREECRCSMSELNYCSPLPCRMNAERPPESESFYRQMSQNLTCRTRNRTGIPTGLLVLPPHQLLRLACYRALEVGARLSTFYPTRITASGQISRTSFKRAGGFSVLPQCTTMHPSASMCRMANHL
jgi:hypothetical protein